MESRIQAAKSASVGARQRSEIRKAAQEFEAIFIAQMLKVMRETIQESGLLGGGFGKTIYTELFDQEVALSLAKRGALGIANLLEQKIVANLEASGKAALDPSPDAAPLRTPGTPSHASPEESAEPSVQGSEISDMQLPVHAPVSSQFGMRRDPFSGRPKFHKGLDLAAPEGMPVVPAMPGTVISAGYVSGYGNTVLVQHANGFQTRYAHLGSIFVNVGETITSEFILGTVGNTGRSTGSHLHFEVIRESMPVDPAASLNLYGSASDAQSKS